MARKPSSRTWEEVPGPRGGVVRFLVRPGSRTRTRAKPAPGDRVLRVRPGVEPRAVTITRSGSERKLPTTDAMRRAERDTWAALGSTSMVGSAAHEWALRNLADVSESPDPSFDVQGVVVGSRALLDRRPSMSARLGVSLDAWKRGGPQVNALANTLAAGRRLVGRATIDVESVWAEQDGRTLYKAARGAPGGLYRTVLDRSRSFFVVLEVQAWNEAGDHVTGLDFSLVETWSGLPSAIVHGLVFPIAVHEGGWEVSSGKAGKKAASKRSARIRVERILAELTVWEVAA